MAEQEARLQIGIDPGNAISAANRLEEALQRVASGADRVQRAMAAVSAQKISISGAERAQRSIQAIQREIARIKPVDLSAKSGGLSRAKADLAAIQQQIARINATSVQPKSGTVRPLSAPGGGSGGGPVSIPSASVRAPDLSGVSRAVGGLSDSFKRLEESVLSVQGVLVGLGVGVAVKSIAQTGMAFDSLSKGLEVAVNSAIQGKEEFARLKTETDRLGLSTLDTGKAYVNFLASVTGSSVSVESAKNTFFGVAQAMSLLGKSPADAERAFNALSQMASKGKITAEELTGQLAEQLPGAFALTAKALGMSTDELTKALEKGEVSIQSFFNSFDGAVRSKFPVERMDSASASFARFGNAMDRAKQIIANGGFLKSAASAAEELARWLDSIEGKRIADELGGVLKSAVDNLIIGFRFLSEHGEAVKTVLQALIAVKVGSWILGIVSSLATLIGSFKTLAVVLASHPLLSIPIILAGGIAALIAMNGKVQDGTAAWADHAAKMRTITSLHDQLKVAQGAERQAIQDKILALQAEAKQAVISIQEQIDKRKELIALESQMNPGGPASAFGPLQNQAEQYGVAEGQALPAQLEAAKAQVQATENVLAGKSPEGVRARGKPTAGTSRGAATVQPSHTKSPSVPKVSGGGGGENIGQQFKSQRAELEGVLAAEGQLVTAYDLGTAAVEEQIRSMEILNRTQSLNPKYTKAQREELQELIGALYDTQKASKYQETSAGLMESITQTQRLTDATMAMAHGAEGSAEATRREEDAIAARNLAIQLGVSGDEQRVASLEGLIRKQRELGADKSNATAIKDITQETDAINRQTDALGLQGEKRTVALATLAEEARLIRENVDLTSKLAQERLKAAGENAVAGNRNSQKADIENMKSQLSANEQYQAALGLTGEAYVRKNAEIAKSVELERQGIDSASELGQQQIELAGQVAVTTDRLQRQNNVLLDLANSGLSANEMFQYIARDGLYAMEDALVDIVTGTKSVKEAFADMARSIAADLARMAIRQAITIPLAGLLGGAFMGPAAAAAPAFGGFTSAAAVGPINWMTPTMHSGGIMGKEIGGPPRMVSPTLFANAPRYHSGKLPANANMPSKLPSLGGGEVAAILKKDEGVFTPAQMQALGPAGGNQSVVMNANINVTQPPGATEQQGQAFGKGIVRELQGMVDERIQRAFRPGGLRNQSGTG